MTHHRSVCVTHASEVMVHDLPLGSLLPSPKHLAGVQHIFIQRERSQGAD